MRANAGARARNILRERAKIARVRDHANAQRSRACAIRARDKCHNPSEKAKVFAKQMVDSIQALTPSQLNIPTEDDDDYDEEKALKKMEEISRDPMRLIYVPEVLHWWVNSSSFIF